MAAKASAIPSATVRASRVLPTPPGPVRSGGARRGGGGGSGRPRPPLPADQRRKRDGQRSGGWDERNADHGARSSEPVAVLCCSVSYAARGRDTRSGQPGAAPTKRAPASMIRARRPDRSQPPPFAGDLDVCAESQKRTSLMTKPPAQEPHASRPGLGPEFVKDFVARCAYRFSPWRSPKGPHNSDPSSIRPTDDLPRAADVRGQPDCGDAPPFRGEVWLASVAGR